MDDFGGFVRQETTRANVRANHASRQAGDDDLSLSRIQKIRRRCKVVAPWTPPHGR